MELILHPGSGKCGSSSIQSFLYFNLENLETSNIWVADQEFKFRFEKESELQPFYKSAPIFYFKNLAESQDGIEIFSNRLTEILDLANKNHCKTLLISAENLTDVVLTKKPGLHRVLQEKFDKIKVIFYVRRQDEWIVSAWQQWGHKTGVSLEEYVENAITLHFPNFLRKVQQLECIYDRKNISVVPLNKKAFKGGNLLADFCFRCGIDANSDKSAKSYNQGLNPYLCDILRRVPSIYEDIHDNSIKKILESLIDTKEILYAKKSILNEDQKCKILDTFEKDNRILVEEYFDAISYDDYICDKIEVNPNKEKEIHEEIENLKEIIAIQTEAILKLVNEQREYLNFSMLESRNEKNNWQRKIGKIFLSLFT
jgi:hypothetical protein